MGNFEKLSVLVIVVIIVMILVVALYTWTDGSSSDTATKDAPAKSEVAAKERDKTVFPIPPTPAPSPTPLPHVLPDSTAPSDTPPKLLVTPAPSPTPSPTPPVVKPVERAETSYVVASGDNATKIIHRQMPGTSVSSGLAALEKANPGVDLNVLRVGQKLVIPGKGGDETASTTKSTTTGKETAVASAPKSTVGVKPGSVYVTHRGDTLPALSKRAYGTTDRWHEIWLANYAAIEDPSTVPAGTSLRIPN